MLQQLGQRVKAQIPACKHNTKIPALAAGLLLHQHSELLVEENSGEPHDGARFHNDLHPLQDEPQRAGDFLLRHGVGSPEELAVVQDGPRVGADGGAQAVGDGEGLDGGDA